MRVRHEGSFAGSPRTTNFFEWVVDADVTATSFSGLALDTLVMTGSQNISGVEYYTGGSALYDVTVSNIHRNTYSDSGSAISHPTTTNCTVASGALGTITTEADTEVITNKAVTVAPDSASRILGGDLAVSTSGDRTVQSDLTSATTNGSWVILLDSNSSSAGNSSEDLNGEGFRQQSSLSLTSLAYGSGPANGPANWVSTEDLISGTAGHTDGLLIYNGGIRYPTQGFDSGDFRRTDEGNANGFTNPGAPASNPNYSGATGERTYLRYFIDTGSTHQNFSFNVTATSTTFVAASNKGSLTGNQVVAEILAPNTTQNGSAVIEYKDMVTAYTSDNAIGAFAASVGATIATNWGVTIGTRSTATSGNAIVIRLTASASWTGSITNISMIFSP